MKLEVKNEKQKIIFLDIDGVLNNDKWMSERDLSGGWVPYFDFCPENVALFNKVLKETNASVVMSSSWRNGKSLDLLQEILVENGKVDERYLNLIDKTLDDGQYPNRRLSERVPRWKYIAKWLEMKAPKDCVFVVIDDFFDAWEQGPNFIWTDPRVGLIEGNANYAIEFLNGKIT